MGRSKTFPDGETQIPTPESKAVEAKIFMFQGSNEAEEIPGGVGNAVTPLAWAPRCPGDQRRPNW